jgi:hypothetical protein
MAAHGDALQVRKVAFCLPLLLLGVQHVYKIPMSSVVR